LKGAGRKQTHTHTTPAMLLACQLFHHTALKLAIPIGLTV